MALAAHPVIINAGAAASPTDEMDGIISATFSPTRDLLDETDFADTSGAHKRFGGLRDGTISLSGDYEASDTAQTALRAAFDGGTEFHVQILWDGTNGHEVETRVESYEISASVEGKVEFSATLQFNAIPGTVP